MIPKKHKEEELKIKSISKLIGIVVCALFFIFWLCKQKIAAVKPPPIPKKHKEETLKLNLYRSLSALWCVRSFLFSGFASRK